MRKPRAKAATDVLRGLAADSDVEAIVAGAHGDPFSVLGVHAAGSVLVARCFVPHAEYRHRLYAEGQGCGGAGTPP